MLLQGAHGAAPFHVRLFLGLPGQSGPFGLKFKASKAAPRLGRETFLPGGHRGGSGQPVNLFSVGHVSIVPTTTRSRAVCDYTSDANALVKLQSWQKSDDRSGNTPQCGLSRERKAALTFRLLLLRKAKKQKLSQKDELLPAMRGF